ncbi:MAG: hypothetical protein ACRCXD_03355 [Luteolibacter sp.]
MEEFVEFDDFLKRSSWMPRAEITRFLIASDDSPIFALEDSSRKSTSGTELHHWRFMSP